MSNTIQLQSIGHIAAIEAGNLIPGDVTVWNFGAKETIISKDRETKAFVFLTIKSERSGDLYERKLKKTRLVGIVK